MALVDVEGVFYATILVGGTRQATAATKWVPIPACSGIFLSDAGRLSYQFLDLDTAHLRSLLANFVMV
jgi:hypothetical protein